MSESAHKHYVPILKGRRGEFPALKTIKDKSCVTPLVEAVPKYDCDFVATKMVKNWELGRPFFVDFLHYPDTPVTSGGSKVHPMERCFQTLSFAGGLISRPHGIPVTGTGRSPDYQKAVKRIVASRKQGIAIRLQAVDFDETDLEAALTAILDLTNVEKSDVDIIIDLGSVASADKGTVSQMHRANLSLLPSILAWRSLTVASSAFPLGLGPLTANQWNPMPRTDWLSWRSLVTGTNRPKRLPRYGDYGIAHPGVPPEGRATKLAQLRYATTKSWLIWKGQNVDKHPRGYDQFLDICQKMVARPECKPASFSEGDRLIHEKATIGGSSGNLETWRQIGLNHHVETVIEQIANLP